MAYTGTLDATKPTVFPHGIQGVLVGGGGGGGSQAAAIVSLTDSTGDSGTHNDTVADGLTATAPGSITAYTPHASGAVAVTSNAATDLDTTAAALDTLNAEVASLRTTVAACVTDLAVQNQNDSDMAQKILEILAALRTYGVIAT